MKKHLIIVSLLALPLYGMAQTDIDLDPETGGRIAVSVDKKVARGLHVGIEEEVRFDNNLTSFNRFHTTLGATYKVLPYLKLGLGYSLINGYDDSLYTFKYPRHRLYFDVTSSHRFGDWQLSIKERIQVTHRTGTFNPYQNPRNAVALKSRLKLAYKGFRRWEPYASIEVRNTLNAPVINAIYNEATDSWGYYDDDVFTTKGAPGWFLNGFKGVYVNRLRGTLGVDYRINRHNTVELYLMGDRTIDKVVDASGKGKKLKSYTSEKGFTGWLCANYSYSF